MLCEDFSNIDYYSTADDGTGVDADHCFVVKVSGTIDSGTEVLPEGGNSWGGGICYMCDNEENDHTINLNISHVLADRFIINTTPAE